MRHPLSVLHRKQRLQPVANEWDGDNQRGHPRPKIHAVESRALSQVPAHVAHGSIKVVGVTDGYRE